MLQSAEQYISDGTPFDDYDRTFKFDYENTSNQDLIKEALNAEDALYLLYVLYQILGEEGAELGIRFAFLPNLIIYGGPTSENTFEAGNTYIIGSLEMNAETGDYMFQMTYNYNDSEFMEVPPHVSGILRIILKMPIGE